MEIKYKALKLKISSLFLLHNIMKVYRNKIAILNIWNI